MAVTDLSQCAEREPFRQWDLEIGGGGSHQRTGLRPLVPCSTGKYREIRRFRAWDSQGASAFGRKFNRLPI